MAFVRHVENDYMSLEIIDPNGDDSEYNTNVYWKQKYERERTRFYDFTREIHDIINKNLSVSGIEVVSVEARTKTVESFFEKLSRNDKSYENPLEDITDLCGCRIICYYVDDIEILDKMVRDCFSVDEGNSIKKDKINNPREFGYLSRHLIVELNKDRLRLNEYKRFSGLKCEIQIRTALQHAWAAIEHKLQYKKKQDVPLQLQRKLFQISAVLELADNQFSYIRENLLEIREEYRLEIESGAGNIPLDIESLDVYLQNSKSFSEVTSALSTGPISVAPTPPTSRNPLAKLNETLRLAGVETIEDFDAAILKRAPNEWLEEFENIAESWRETYKSSLRPPAKLVLDETAIARILIIMEIKKEKAKKILSEIPFGARLHAALNLRLLRG